MLEHVKHQDKIEELVPLLSDVRQPEVQRLVCSRGAQLKRLRRDVVAPQNAVGVQVLLQLTENLARSTAHVADALGGHPIPVQHQKDLPSLPGRLSDVPSRISAKILSLFVEVLRGSRKVAPHSRAGLLSDPSKRHFGSVASADNAAPGVARRIPRALCADTRWPLQEAVLPAREASSRRHQSFPGCVRSSLPSELQSPLLSRCTSSAPLELRSSPH